MPHSTGIHHIHKKRKRKPKEPNFYSIYDKIMIVVSVLVPLSNLPQLFKIWLGQDASGVSSLSWILFAFFSFIA